MAITIQEIADRVNFVTKDAGMVRFTLAEIVAWARDAIDQIATIHPRVASQYVPVTLAAGSRQDLRVASPTTKWIRLYEVVSNVNSAGAAVGHPIRRVALQSLNFSRAGWNKPPATEVREYAADEREAYTFDVYPPVAAGTRVLALAAIKPPPIDDEDSVFPLPDGYDIPAVDYILFRLFSKDANDASYAQRAATHLQAFNLSMGVETKDASAE